MSHELPSLRRHIGFTLTEVIVTLVIVGIVSGMVAVFLKVPVQGYLDMAGRAELSDVADTAVRRMTRELRLAVPNSIRVNAARTVVEFVPTKAGGRYLSAVDAQPASNPILDFETASNRSVTVIGPMPTGRQAIAAGDFIVVYNIGVAPGDVYGGANRATVESAVGQIVTMVSNPFPTQPVPRLAHPDHRFLVASSPITYRCAPPQLLRHSGYPIAGAFSDVPGGTVAVLASNVVSCSFDQSTLANSSSAMLSVTLVLQRPGSTNENLTLVQQIHVSNDP